VSRRRWLLTGVAATAVMLLLGRVWADMYGDYLWHAAQGTAEVWRARAIAGAALTIGSGAVAWLFAFLNLLAVRRSVVSLVLPRRVANVEFGEEIPGGVLTGAALLMSLLLGAILALPSSGWWRLLLAVDGASFGEIDPYFQNDLGFYVVQLPLEAALYSWAIITASVVAFFVVLLYALTPSLRWRQSGFYATSYVRRHVTVLGGLLLLLLAWGFRLQTYRMLGQGSGPDGAFGYVDHTIGIPGNLALAVAATIAGLIVIWAGWSGQTRLAVLGITAVLVLALVVRFVAPSAASRFATAQEREVRERPYLATRTGYSRRAFGADRVTLAAASSRFESVASAARGAPAWDPLAVAHALRYADPAGAGARAGWRSDDGTLELILSEPTPVAEPLQGGRWRVDRLLAAYSEGGAPVWAGSDSPGPGSTLAAVMTETPTPHLVVSDTSRSIAGVPLSGGARRLALAWSLRDVDLLLEKFPGAQPVVVSRRGVAERIRKLAPPFDQLGDAMVAMSADTLIWVVPLYSTSRTYPLSRQMEVAGQPVNWLRQTSTALVNATTGRVRLVADSAADPLTSAWRSRFPGLYTGWGAVSPDVRRSVAPAKVGSRATAVAFARFGTRDQRVGRSGHVPPWNGADSVLAGERVVMAGPSTDRLASLFPVLSEEDIVVGAVMVTGGGDGGMSWLPASTGHGWTELASTLAAAGGDAVAPAPLLVHGPIRVLPVADRLSFFQPEYSWPDGGAPVLRRVTLKDGEEIDSGSSLVELVGVAQRDTVSSRNGHGEHASRLYQRMRQALAASDWVTFGRLMDSLGLMLQRGMR
jgi:uncharacterized protein